MKSRRIEAHQPGLPGLGCSLGPALLMADENADGLGTEFHDDETADLVSLSRRPRRWDGFSDWGSLGPGHLPLAPRNSSFKGLPEPHRQVHRRRYGFSYNRSRVAVKGIAHKERCSHFIKKQLNCLQA